MPDWPDEPNALFILVLMVEVCLLFDDCCYGPLKEFNYAAFVSKYC
jgi:hypothetical protein